MDVDELAKLKGVIECEAPNEFLDSFDGNIVYQKEKEIDNVPASLRSLNLKINIG